MPAAEAQTQTIKKTRRVKGGNQVVAEPQAPVVPELPTAPAGIKVVEKGNREYQHDLFKLGLAKFKKNVSYVLGKPRIVETEHVHYFHSHNKKGRVNTYSAPVGNHLHKIDYVLKDGVITSLTCGPPLHQVVVSRRPGGKKRKVLQRVVYISDQEDSKGRSTDVHDDHTHDVEYLHSEVISAARLQQSQAQDSKKFAQLQAARGEEQPEFTPDQEKVLTAEERAARSDIKEG